MIKVSAYSPQRYNNQQLKRQNNASFGMKVIQPPETVKDLTFADLVLHPPDPMKEKIWERFKPSKPSADGKDSPFHML